MKPYSFTAEEKKVLAEYLRRGGFILFFIDAYPYDEDQLWSVSDWPVMDFIQRELPAADPEFSSGKASDGNQIFKVYYQTSTADAIFHELRGNPNTPNRPCSSTTAGSAASSWASTAGSWTAAGSRCSAPTPRTSPTT